MNIKKEIKKLTSYNYFSRKLALFIYCIYCRFKYKLNIENSGCSKLKKTIIGKGNKMKVKNKSIIDNLSLIVKGNNNYIEIGEDCRIGPNCVIRVEGSNIVILIGDNTTFTRSVELCAQEDNTKITLGNNCMLSNSIIIRTSDSHPIFDINNHQRINLPGNVKIGNNVWIAPNCKIMKNSIIGNGAIIGSDTTVSKSVPDNCLYVGRPGKVVKENIYWNRNKLF